MKTCTKCNETKPTTEFGKHAGRPDGLNSRCKTCHKAGQTAYLDENRDKVNAKSAAYQVAYRAANPDKVKARNVAYRAANKDKEKARKSAYRAAHRDKVRASRAAAWRAANRDKESERRAAYRATHRDEEKASAAAWRAANPEARRIYEHNRRARKLENGGRLSKGLTELLFKLQRGKCACCGVSIADGNHLDHRIPVALGGPNEDWNMQLLCAPCNLSKGAKHPVDFMRQRGFLL
jgi:5-methylcytosine-specific restriction endonuclease McrA